jgi:putative DNA primase/helicase
VGAQPPGSDIPQGLRQLWPIRSLDDLGVAACEAARLVRDRTVGRIEAVDGLYRMAEGAGLVYRYGDDVVQAYIGAGFEAIKIEPKEANGTRFEDGDTDDLDAQAQRSGSSHGTDTDAEGTEAPHPPQGKRVAVLRRASDIEPEPIDWAWKDRFAFGKLALIAGDPGLGKSQVAIDIIARCTLRDAFPCGEGYAPQCESLILTAEDALKDTVIPRLIASGADRSKVHILTGTKIEGAAAGEEDLFDLTRDVAVLRDVLRTNRKIRIIIIDPLTAYLGETQAHKNAQVRKVLTPLVKLVEDYGVLVIGVTHLNKSAGKAIYRVLDSIAFVALGRILHLVIQDSDNPDNRKFLCDKTNIGPKPAGLTFICQQVEVPTSRGNIWMSRVSWGTQTISQTADEAIATATLGANERTNALNEAVEFLERLLADGPVASTEVFKAAKANGIAAATLRRAKEKRGVVARHDESFDGGWKWCLPSQDDQNSPR